VNPNTNQIYVANYSGNNVTVIDGATISTTTTLASNLNPSTLNASVTFTATVAENPGTGTATGTVAFNDGSTTLGTATLNASAVATFATSSLAVGQHSMTAVYSGDANNAGSTSAVLTQTVNAAGFTLTFNPTSKTITAGQSGTFTLTVTPQGSFTNSISFSCSGLPALAGCTFKPASATPNASTVTTTLTITTTAHTASLASPFGRRSSPLYAIWLVLPAMLLGTVRMAAPKRRKLLSYCLAFLLVSGCLLQVACSGASNGSGGGGGGTPSGSYTISVTGAAGSTQYAAPVTLIVQ
jgi:DNA-binding beta-propeller fold protein YncE